jgi:hypothetical protein
MVWMYLTYDFNVHHNHICIYVRIGKRGLGPNVGDDFDSACITGALATLLILLTLLILVILLILLTL